MPPLYTRHLAGLASLLLALAATGVALGGGLKNELNPGDQALAKSIRIKLSDLPHGFKASRPTNLEAGAVGPHCKGVPDESDLTVTGKSVSPLFDQGSDTSPGFYSGASVFPSAGEVLTAFRREMRPALVRCLIRWTISDFESGIPIKVVLVSQSLKPLSVIGVQASAIRLVFKFVNVPHMRFAEDLIVLHKRRVEAWLTGIFNVKLQARFAFENRLLAKIATRMP
jgi:hypothetical protein